MQIKPTTEFDHLMKQSFRILFNAGSANEQFIAKRADDCYLRMVKPDFVLPDKSWVDFKLRVSYRESQNLVWQPSALYSSLRKYIDHASNSKKSLLIIYGKLYGTVDDVKFPIQRGSKTLIHDEIEFFKRVSFQSAIDSLSGLRETDHEWLINKLTTLLNSIK